ncbi:MAG TPA: hypothetical protein VMA53_04035 [Stellaceae bacterium]|nr:hypothetical protein [Stellaceae bacterium]
MPLVPLKIRPGVNTQATPTLLEAGWAACQLVRFREALLQKLGGWAKAFQSAFTGVCRALHSWTQIDGLPDLGIGTHLKLCLWQLGQFFDLTPVQNSGTSSTNFYTTTTGSASVTVNIAAHGAGVGDYYEALTSATANGVTIFGEYTVTAVVDANDLTITASTNATASGSFGNGAQWQLLLSVGLASNTPVQGYGAGPYGAGPYGESSGTIYYEPCRLWFIDNWGEFMLACLRGGGVYQWQPSSGTSTRASLLANAPTLNNGMLVALPQQQVVVWGTNQGVSEQQPLLVAWSDVGNNTMWTASTTNQAGSYQIPRGSKIVGAVGAPLVILLWTNEGLWLMQYVGLPFVYSFTQVGFGCGLIAPKGAATTPFSVFWMTGDVNFYSYSGSVAPIECTVRDRIAGNINTLQLDKVFAAVDSQYNEVWWFYPSINSIEIDSYVKYNYVEQLWDYGLLARTAWEDHKDFAYPMATDPNSFLYNHEFGVDADGTPMDSWAETGYLALTEGDDVMMVERVLPDLNTFAGQVQLSAFAVTYPNSDTPVQTGPVTATAGATPYVTLRARGRGVAFKIESNYLGGDFRWGGMRAVLKKAGKR